MSELELLRQEIMELKSISLIANKAVLDMNEAVMYTGLVKKTLYNLCRERSIPHYKSATGGRTYFKKEELDQWMLHTKVNTSAEITSEVNRRVYFKSH